MGTIIQRVLSLVIAIAYVTGSVASEIVAGHGVSPAILGVVAILLLPLAMIWFPEEVGSFTGYVRGAYIDTETPAVLVSIMGWFFLVGMPCLLCVIWS